MKKLIIAMAAIVLSAGSVWAVETNFRPAHMSGNTPAPEMSAAKAAAHEKKQKAPHVPGFWDKEYERSGFKKAGDSVAQSASSFKAGGFFKGQEEKYRERHPAGTDSSTKTAK